MEQEKKRDFSLGLAIIVLLNRFVYLVAQALHFPDITKVLFFGFCGLTSLVLGLFVFHRGLSFGCVVGGVIATYMAWLHYHLQLTEMLQFLVSMIVLSVLCFALYRFYKSVDHVKEGK